MIGSCAAMRRVHTLIERAGPTDVPVLVLGESGTGKELVARALHDSSGRKGGLVAVNCAALNEGLLESELFGHERGAFSGAVSEHVGRFERAHGGTLFLDEVAEMSPAMQAKLLRAIQHGEIERVGGKRLIRVDVRIVAATNKDLAQEMLEKRFREDLFHRLNCISITLPPLRLRGSDLDELIAHLMPEREIAMDALEALRAHSWPGNVRELEQTLRRASILAEGPVRVEDLQLPPYTETSGKVTLKDVTRNAVVQALEEHGWSQKEAAASLGISGPAFNYRVKSFGITHSSWKKNRPV